MDNSLIYDREIVSKISLLNLGFSNKELKYLAYKKILKSNGKDFYMVLEQQKFEIILLKKLLEFDRTIITEEELNFLGINSIVRERLFSYGIIRKIDDDRFEVVGDINKIKKSRTEIDMYLYKKLYKQNRSKGRYIIAKKYLEKYIEICEDFNIEEDYYYKLTNLNNDIEKQKLNIDDLYRYYELKKEYKKLNEKKNYKEALTVAYSLYKINPGSMEATTISSTRLSMGKTNYDKILEFLYEAIEKDKTNPKAYKYLGEVYCKKKLYTKSVDALQKYIKLDKNCNYDGYLSLFDLYLITNDIGEAHMLFSNVISIIPEKKKINFIDSCLQKTKKCIFRELSLSKDNAVRLGELNNLKNTISKELSLNINDYREIEKENEKYSGLEFDIEELLMPDENNIVNTKKIDSYIANLDVSIEEKDLIILRTSLILARNNYFDKADSYIVILERNKNKTAEVKQQIDSIRKKIKFIKRQN